MYEWPGATTSKLAPEHQNERLTSAQKIHRSPRPWGCSSRASRSVLLPAYCKVTCRHEPLLTMLDARQRGAPSWSCSSASNMTPGAKTAPHYNFLKLARQHWIASEPFDVQAVDFRSTPDRNSWLSSGVQFELLTFYPV